MPNILTRIENVVDSAKWVRTELKKRQKKYLDMGMELDHDKGVGRFLSNSIFAIDIVCKETSALRALCKRILTLAPESPHDACITVTTTLQRQILRRFAREYCPCDRRYRKYVVVPVEHHKEVLARCINGVFAENALYARSIRKELNALR